MAAYHFFCVWCCSAMLKMKIWLSREHEPYCSGTTILVDLLLQHIVPVFKEAISGYISIVTTFIKELSKEKNWGGDLIEISTI